MPVVTPNRVAASMLTVNAVRILLGVRFASVWKLELVDALAGEGEADPAAGLPDHEVDQLGRNELRRADEIAFVLAVLIVGDDDDLAGFDVGDGLFNGSELHDSSVLQRKV